jgi:hypothetical protein
MYEPTELKAYSSKSTQCDDMRSKGLEQTRMSTAHVHAINQTIKRIRREAPVRSCSRMTDIGFIGNNRPETNPLAHSRPADMVQGMSKSSAESQETSAPEGDRIEISDHARHLAAIKRLPDTRIDKVDAARQAITEGVLNSEEMLEKALEIMISESKYL